MLYAEGYLEIFEFWNLVMSQGKKRNVIMSQNFDEFDIDLLTGQHSTGKASPATFPCVLCSLGFHYRHQAIHLIFVQFFSSLLEL